MELLLVLILLGLVTAFIAEKKGRSFGLWWVYGAFLFIVAFPHALLMESDRVRKCPFCAEVVKKEAVVCRFCSRPLPAAAPDPPAVRSAFEKRR